MYFYMEKNIDIFLPKPRSTPTKQPGGVSHVPTIVWCNSFA